MRRSEAHAMSTAKAVVDPSIGRDGAAAGSTQLQARREIRRIIEFGGSGVYFDASARHALQVPRLLLREGDIERPFVTATLDRVMPAEHAAARSVRDLKHTDHL